MVPSTDFIMENYFIGFINGTTQINKSRNIFANVIVGQICLVCIYIYYI